MNVEYDGQFWDWGINTVPIPVAGGAVLLPNLSGTKAIVTGVSGQDGSYLVDHLITAGAEVIGIVRGPTGNTYTNIEKMIHKDKMQIFYGDMASPEGICNLISETKPTFFFNLAAQSHVGVSFEYPEITTAINFQGYLKILEAVRRFSPLTRIYQASTSEMFGGYAGPANEKTPFRPRSPYGVAKLASHWAGVNYRESYGLHISNGILFNHESPRRPESFVTAKIVKAACNIKLGRQKTLSLGNITAGRDWGHARDYTKAMVLMLARTRPDDYVIGTGTTHTVEWFLKTVFERLGLDSEGCVVYEKSLVRPNEVQTLTADATKAREILGWYPETTLEQLIEEMIATWLS